MSFCGFCGATLPTDATFCGECGRKTDEPFVDPNVRAAPTDASTVAMPVIVPATPDHDVLAPTPAPVATPVPTSAAEQITGVVPTLEKQAVGKQAVDKKQGLPGGVTGLIGLVGLIAVAVGIYIITKDDDSSTKAPIVTIASATTLVENTSTAATSVPVDPEQVAAQELQTVVAQDRSTANSLVGSWVVQLSAKRVGLEADGIVYGPIEILADHEMWRAQYGVILVDAGAFQFTSGGSPMTGWFLTIVLQQYASKEAALQFCTDNGLGGNVCLAREFKQPNP